MSIDIRYELLFEDQRKLTYDIQLDEKNLSLLKPQTSSVLPEWTRLEVEQCKNCPLSSETAAHCPISANLSLLVNTFKDEISHTRVKVKVTTVERTYYKEVAVQEALFSLFGLIMATSGCPVMNYLKPMARYHLPFSSIEESIVRSVSMHLLRQYFRAQEGENVNYDLKDLDSKYAEIGKVNIGLSKRIATVMKSGDANQNTVTTFDCIAKMLSMSINRNLKNYSYLFTD